MTLKEQLEAAQARSKAIEEHIDSLHKEQYDLDANISEVARDYIKESGLLAKCKWEASNYFSDPSIKISSNFNNLDKEMVDLLKPSYHCKFDLEPGVTLIFDDNKVSLIFDDKDATADFLLRNDINVDVSKVEESIKKHQKIVDISKVFIEKFK